MVCWLQVSNSLAEQARAERTIIGKVFGYFRDPYPTPPESVEALADLRCGHDRFVAWASLLVCDGAKLAHGLGSVVRDRAVTPALLKAGEL